MITLRFMLGVVAAENLDLIQLDVKMTFLHDDLYGAAESLCGIRSGTSSLPTQEESIWPETGIATVVQEVRRLHQVSWLLQEQ